MKWEATMFRSSHFSSLLCLGAALASLPWTLRLSEAHQDPGAEQVADAPKILNCVAPLGHHVVQSNYVCPLGGEQFQSLDLGTHSTYGVYLDWKPLSYIDFPVPLPVCPSNGFVIAQRDYDEETLALIAAIIESDAYQTLYKSGNASYYLLAEIKSRLGVEEDERWWLLLNASWEADGCGDQDKYKLYALEAIDAMQQRLAKLDELEAEFWVINLIIPNLYRRMADFESAQSFLQRLEDKAPRVGDSIENTFQLGRRLLDDAIAKGDIARIALREPERK